MILVIESMKTPLLFQAIAIYIKQPIIYLKPNIMQQMAHFLIHGVKIHHLNWSLILRKTNGSKPIMT